MSSRAIPIHYKNLTGRSDFQILVFVKNHSLNTPTAYNAAWEVLNAQSEACFEYPQEIQVGASYLNQDQIVQLGPFRTKLGATWSIDQGNGPNDTAILSKGELYTHTAA